LARLEETADCTAFQTFDCSRPGSATSVCTKPGQPAIVIGRYEGTVLFLMPFAIEGSAGLLKITWLGSFSLQLQRPCAGARLLRGA
jgi:CelD/BcsL family acetyltransferase involved in cellulose biosynthesis